MKVFQGERLLAVGKGFGRSRVNLNHNSVCPGGGGGRAIGTRAAAPPPGAAGLAALAHQSRTPHPQPLSLKGRGEQDDAVSPSPAVRDVGAADIRAAQRRGSGGEGSSPVRG